MMIYRRMSELIRQHDTKRIIFLGDIKHGTSKILKHEWIEVPSFFEKLLNDLDEIIIIPGNHDGGLKSLLPSDIKLCSSKGMSIRDNSKKIYLMHGHAWSSPEAFGANIMIMGHHHFTVEFKESSGFFLREPVWFITRYNKLNVVRAYLEYRNISGGDNPVKVFENTFKINPGTPKLIVMPTFNKFLSGIPLNTDKGKNYLGPFFRAGEVDIMNSEIFLLDGTYIKLSKEGIIERKNK